MNAVEDNVVEEHDCEFVSGCCGAFPYNYTELSDMVTGFCGSCGDGAGFSCQWEGCPIDSYYIYERWKNDRYGS